MEVTRSEVLAWLERKGTRRNVVGLARYGIVAHRAFGVPVGTLLGFAKRLGKDHALATALWESGWYEARLLAAMVEDPARVTRRQMPRRRAAGWARTRCAIWRARGCARSSLAGPGDRAAFAP